MPHKLVVVYIVAALLATGLSLVCVKSYAAPTNEPAKRVQALRQSIGVAGKLYQQKKYRESAEIIKRVQLELSSFPNADSPEVQQTLISLLKSIRRARVLLKKQGIQLPAWKPDKRKNAKVDHSTPTPNPGTSFVMDVAPILVKHCGRCHIQKSRGDFSMIHFSSLLRGPPETGRVIIPGDPGNSRLVALVQTGDMPRGNDKVSPEELSILKQWIMEGAGFDGPNPRISLARLAPAATPLRPATKITVARASGAETISFSLELAPVLSQRCNGCHGSDNPANDFSVASFSRLLQGGESGPVISLSTPKQSLLLQKLQGTAPGMRMPGGGQSPLADTLIAKFEQWLTEGAKFDGPDDKLSMDQLEAIVFAREATPTELNARRVTLANSYWELGLPGIASSQTETEHFHIVGASQEMTLAQIGTMAEHLWKQVSTYFKMPKASNFKGRITLFVMEKRYDYSEFGKMVERRDLPLQQQAHWKYNGLDAYAALVADHQQPDQLKHTVARQLAAIYIQSLGDVPFWFAEGSARVFASSLAKHNSKANHWDSQIVEIVRAMKQPDDFMNDRLLPESTSLVSYGFVKQLKKKKRHYQRLLATMHAGQHFSDAFISAYGATPSEYAKGWAGMLR